MRSDLREAHGCVVVLCCVKGEGEVVMRALVL